MIDAFFWIIVPDNEQLLRARIRQRPEQDRIDDAEDRGIRSDAEREGQGCRKSETGRFAELAEGEAKIAHDNRLFVRLIRIGESRPGRGRRRAEQG